MQPEDPKNDDIQRHFKNGNLEKLKEIVKDTEAQLEVVNAKRAKLKDDKPSSMEGYAARDEQLGALEEPLRSLSGRLSAAQTQIQNIQSDREEKQKALMETGRGSQIVDGLDEELAFDYDYQQFEGRVLNLFEWHEKNDVTKKYVAPYFAVIQSSGMGKTRLFTELRNRVKKKCKAFEGKEDFYCLSCLCVPSDLLDKQRDKYYDGQFDFRQELRKLVKGQEKPNENDIRIRVHQLMKGFIEKSKGKKNVILLFDEAQGLMLGDDNFVFRVIRQFLREDRGTKVVAVFAGTTLKLSNFHPPDSSPHTVSRNPETFYKNFKEGDDDTRLQLYLPFFQFNTIGCLRAKPLPDDAEVTLETAAQFGRPLFAFYNKGDKGDLEDKLPLIAKRLLLSVGANEYDKHPNALFSLLASRVQMGTIRRPELASELVSGGYACLVGLPSTGKDVARNARIAFLPDPVCAYLAMRFMDEKEEIKAKQGMTGSETASGMSKKKWSAKAQEAFSTQLCQAEQGNAGEVFAALYMLFCGDSLRKNQYTTFSVSLDDWFQSLITGEDASLRGTQPTRVATSSKMVEASKISTRRSPKHQSIQDSVPTEASLVQGEGLGGIVKGAVSQEIVKKAPQTQQRRNPARAAKRFGTSASGPEQQKLKTSPGPNVNTSGGAVGARVSVIQFCRNYFRSQSYLKGDTLKMMYQSGVGHYTFPNCPAIDCVLSVMVPKQSDATKTPNTSYHPLLVSVKSWKNATKNDVVRWKTTIEQLLTGMREDEAASQNSAVCLIILIGCEDTPKPSEFSLSDNNLDGFPENDVYRLVNIPKKDEFGISEAVDGLGISLEPSEILASHPFLYTETGANKEEVAKNALRSDSEQGKALAQLYESFTA